MVKGISKRTILVKAPPNTMFEEAIFILKEEPFGNSGVDADEILKQACDVATRCANRAGGRVPKKVISAASLVALGASCMGFIWILSAII